MTIEDELKCLILERYKSLREFALEAEVPYTTVDSMLKRGIMNASIGKVIKICRHLGISVDGLAEGEIVPYEKSDSKPSIEEWDLIAKYRMLDERGKSNIRDDVERELKYAKIFVEESLIGAGVG